MRKYQNNKQQLLNQSRKRHETATFLAAAQSCQKKVEKSFSLPSLKPKR